MKILVTGSGGFIGKNIAEQWKDKYNVKSPRSNELDLLDCNQVGEYLRKHQFDIIIHSAKRDDVKYQLTDYDVLDSNLRMFYNLEKFHDDYGMMYYFGSGAEYDRSCMKPKISEEYFGCSIPKDSYGFSKYIMAKEAEKNNNIYDFRLFGVFGKYEAWKRRFISNAIYRAINNLPITIQQNVYFDYLWVDDLVKLMEYFVQNKPMHKHYNLCRGTSIDLYWLANKVREVSGKKLDILVEKDGMKAEYSGENKRLIDEVREYNFEDFDTSIEKLYMYYQENAKEFSI